MSIQTISDRLASRNIKHAIVYASSMPKKITPKQYAGFKSAMSQDEWSANDNWNKMTYGIESPIYHLLKDITSQLGGSDGWRSIKLADINKSLDGDKVYLTYYTPSDYVKKLFATAAFGKKPSVEVPENWDSKLAAFKASVEDLIEAYNKKNDFKRQFGSKVVSEDAQKYTKVFVQEPSGNKKIYCFIDRSNGDILKPATYTTPAKGPRGNLFDEHNGMKRMGPYGPEYNK